MGIEPELHDDDPASSTLSPVVAIPEGFLMERYNISDELAFDLLRASARAAHLTYLRHSTPSTTAGRSSPVSSATAAFPDPLRE